VHSADSYSAITFVGINLQKFLKSQKKEKKNFGVFTKTTCNEGGEKGPTPVGTPTGEDKTGPALLAGKKKKKTARFDPKPAGREEEERSMPT